jgi:uncharacterized 2Fe-2S/4Fe-4S cluster protein (DUF4445 family)
MESEFTVMFEPLGIKTRCPKGTLLIDLIRELDIPLAMDCGGLGVCGKCQVKTTPAGSLSPLTDRELELFSPADLEQGRRLACKAKVQGPLTVSIPQGQAEQSGAPGKTGLSGSFAVDPFIQRLVLDIAKTPDLSDHAMGDLASWVESQAGQDLGPWRRPALEGLAAINRLSGPHTLVRHRFEGISAIMAGSHPGSLGLAVDLGTTTIAGYLCDLTAGDILASAGTANPQRRYGEDVISRIGFINEHQNGLPDLQELVVQAIEGLIQELCSQSGRDARELDEICLVGNTTMQHIFSGLHPGSLGRAPYLPVIQSGLDIRASQLGLKLPLDCNVHVFPAISGYVGGDAVAAVLAQGEVDPEMSLMVVDLGTNGELVLLHGGQAWATSCATGPAFEGAHISCGVRAAPGAIHKAAPGEDSHMLDLEVIGGAEQNPAVGLCGSGLIDVIAVLHKQGRILPSGRLKEGAACVFTEGGVGRKVELVPAGQGAGNQPVCLTLQDVRQVQLAKGAMCVGIEMLLEKAGVESVDRTILTGAFGARFNWRNAVSLGILPRQAAAGEVLAVENSAGVGAVMGLLSAKERQRAEELARRIQVVELSMQPEFNMRFAMATGFPELDKQTPAT